MAQTVLLLGGYGFVGQALSRDLTAEGYSVLLAGKQEDFSRLVSMSDVIVHLASTTTPGLSAHHPALEIGNLSVTLNLLEQLEQFPSKHLIFFSSGGSIYGNPKQSPVLENYLLNPLSYHAAGKAAIEQFLNVLSMRMPVTILRPSNIYGPGQPLREGFGFIRHLLENAQRKQATTVWGDGSQTRDFIYIDDVVAACKKFIEKKFSGIYHLGSGESISINEVINLSESIIGQKIIVNRLTARRGDVQNIVLNMDKTNQALSWSCEVDLEEGIRRTWAWLQT